MSALIENHRQPKVAIVDVLDYLILRAVAHSHAGNQPALDANGPSNAEFASLTEQDRYNRAMDYYLAEACSTGRMAELLQIPWAEMRERFNRLGVPLFLGPTTIEEAREDAANARKWAQKARKQG